MMEREPSIKLIKFAVKNFMGISDTVKIPIAPVTLLFGANSAGKSSLITAFKFAANILATKKISFKEMGTGLTFKDVVHNHDIDNEMRFDFHFEIGEKKLPLHKDMSYRFPELKIESMLNVKEFSVGFSIALIKSGEHFDAALQYVDGNEYRSKYAEKPIVGISEYYVTVNGVPLIATEVDWDVDYPSISAINWKHELMMAFTALNSDYRPKFEQLGNCRFIIGQFGPSRSTPSTGALPSPDYDFSMIPPDMETNEWKEVNKYGDEFDFFFNQVLVGPVILASDYLKKARHIGPFRTVPDSGYVSGHDTWYDGQAAWRIIKEDEWDQLFWFDADVLRLIDIGYALRKMKYWEIPETHPIMRIINRLGKDEAVDVEDLRELEEKEIEKIRSRAQIEIVDLSRNIPVSPELVGTGVAQVIPILIGALAPGTNVYTVQQPELHLHPAAQCQLGDVFICQSAKYPRRVQVLETHSEHLILRLLRRIRETTDNETTDPRLIFEPTDLSVIYVSREIDGMMVHPLAVSAEGEFKTKWPDGFFNERSEELF